MFDRIVRRFLDHTFDPKPPVLTAPKKIIYFCLPFTGIHSLQIRTYISGLCNAAFLHLDNRFVFRSSRRISFFPFKESSQLGYQNIWVSLQSRENTQPTLLSLILSHTNASGHSANFEDFQILSSSSDLYELMIHQSFLVNTKLSFMSYVFVTSYPSSHFHIFS